MIRKFIMKQLMNIFLEKATFEQLNYCQQLNRLDSKSIFIQLHNCESKREILINSLFTFKKINVSLQDYVFSKPFDIIFYDAFAPRAQPELWTEEIFTKLFDALNSNGSLVTYCSKGNVQRAMQAARFIVEHLPGPPHKREILRAVKE